MVVALECFSALFGFGSRLCCFTVVKLKHQLHQPQHILGVICVIAETATHPSTNRGGRCFTFFDRDQRRTTTLSIILHSFERSVSLLKTT
jgi:hypothetical protein